ncbi:MAG TPA: methyltransferase domain-containing protein [Chloroflexota bacterium]|nr:methyltransferase domain-containing protein [Chloroflexota bacterium]
MAQRAQEPNYLLTQQYRTDANLSARASLHQRFSTNQEPGGWFAWLFERLLAGIPADADVLEIGAGPGWLWQGNAVRIPAGWRLTLTDFSPGMVDAARANVALPGVRFEVVDAQHIPFGDGAFDAVVANHMLYHVPDRPRALEDIRRVLRPGGRLFAATNGEAHMGELSQVARVIGGDAAGERISTAFSLENGAAQLAPYFAPVSIESFPDSLEVTDPDAVIAYLRSAPTIWELNAAQEAEARRQVQAAIAAHGTFHITKSVGLFTAIKQE